jgi:hypothetical protein
MFFKKHLAVVITSAVMLVISVSLVFTAVMFSGMAKESARLSVEKFRMASAEHNRVGGTTTTNDTDANLKEHEKDVIILCGNIVSSTKQIQLPDDLFENAVWKYVDEKDEYLNNATHFAANFTYKDKPVVVKFYVGGLGVIPQAFIQYDNKYIVATESFDGPDSYFCENLVRHLPGENSDVFIDSSFAIINEKNDVYPENIFDSQSKTVAKYVETIMPYASAPYGNGTISENDVTVLKTDEFELKRPAGNGYYYLTQSNGRIAHYEPAVPAGTTKITFNDKHTDTVASFSSKTSGGCVSLPAFIGKITLNDLVESGTMSNGDPIYVYRDSEKVRSMYDGIYYPGDDLRNKISFDEFLSSNPYFIWFDRLGTAIEFRLTKFVAAAECGKPVIYLYPEKDTIVSVKVEPNGGFKFTEPAYNGGWNVWATTQSELTNISDGASYPYLFWEGKAYNYEAPDKGFVLRRENVARDMATLLKRLGLNEKESADFMEFWQPKLEVKPFVYVGFLPQTEFDKLAPLTVTPAPDKVIRVFMDYTPLEQFVSVPPIEITMPTRTGFTVVEWGGRLR